jgi:4-amino-4-deoxy-L-arabinose transferase-like glycosyltransferase
VALARSSENRQLRDLATVVALWLTIGFALFTLSLTKFHHYALPCAPPLAVAAALLLDRALGERRLPADRRRGVPGGFFRSRAASGVRRHAPA